MLLLKIPYGKSGKITYVFRIDIEHVYKIFPLNITDNVTKEDILEKMLPDVLHQAQLFFNKEKGYFVD